MKTLKIITAGATTKFGVHDPPEDVVFVHESGVRIYAGPNAGPDRIEIHTGIGAASETVDALRCVMKSVENTVIRIDDSAVVIGLRLAGGEDMIPLRVIRLVTP